MKTLSILIPTVAGREAAFDNLQTELLKQIRQNKATEKVEILSQKDNKEISIGAKRQLLYEMAKGKYSVQIDDDDSVSKDFIKDVLIATKQNPDCIGYFERCTMDGVIKKSKISIECKEWKDVNSNGLNFLRTPFFKTPILTSLCLQVGVKDMRYAEDHDFAKRIFQLLKNEIFIEKEMYYYSANSMPIEQSNKRYGII